VHLADFIGDGEMIAILFSMNDDNYPITYARDYALVISKT